MVYYKALQVKTAKEAMNHGTPSLAGIKRQMIVFDPEKGDLLAKAFLTAIITDLVMFFNVGKTMNQSQVVQVVEMIQTDCYFLKPSELKYCFDNAKTGKYGTVYDRIDGNVIFGFIDKYLEERMGIVHFENERQHEEYKRGGFEVSETVAEALKNIDFKTVDKPSLPKAKYVPKVPENDTEVFIQSLFKEFDEIYGKHPVGENRGKRFIEYGKLIVDQDEFIDVKLKERNKEML